MVTRKNLNNKCALISVYDKKSLKFLCTNFIKFNYTLISTGSTSKEIRNLGFKCIEISKITKFKEIMEGRVKTLNPKIFGSILYLRNNTKHVNEFKKLKTPKIDIVVVNLYPFKTFSKLNDNERSLEMIDIGGPSLIRAASKNYNNVTTVCNVGDYKKLIENLKKNNGETDLNFRKKMATKVFKITSDYDQLIFKWFNDSKNKNKKVNLRYGENPGQKAFILKNKNKSIFDYQIGGKQISYNNILDVDSGYKCLLEFQEPTCVIVKHTNPCGVASSNNISKAFSNALLCDNKSAFGGIVLLNRKVNSKLANVLTKSFFEIILAPKFEKSALKILQKKRNLILLEMSNVNIKTASSRTTIFGELYQKEDFSKIDSNFLNLVSKKKSSDKSIKDMVFALKIVKHLKSNAIVLAKNKRTIGIGVGQTNRVDALKFALENMKKNLRSKNFVCVSDGFFPFTDSVKILNKNKCYIFSQPSGSINDKNIIKFVNEKKMSLYFMKKRLFKH